MIYYIINAVYAITKICCQAKAKDKVGYQSVKKRLYAVETRRRKKDKEDDHHRCCAHFFEFITHSCGASPAPV